MDIEKLIGGYQRQSRGNKNWWTFKKFKNIELELGVWEGQGSQCSQNRGREKKECRESSKDKKQLLFKSPTEYWSTYVCEEAIQKNHSKQQRSQCHFWHLKAETIHY